MTQTPETDDINDPRESREVAAYRRAMSRIGGACGVLGGVGFLIAGALHGDLPSDTEDALRYLAPRPEWPAVHLVAMVSALLFVPAFKALACVLEGVAGRILGQLALVSAAIGVAIFFIDYSIDGYVMKYLAEEWAASTGPDKADRLLVADAVLGVIRGTVVSSLTWMLGLPFLIAGLAVALGGGLPRWLGWVAALTGGGTTLAGMAVFVGAGDPVFVAGILLSFPSFAWLVVVGVLLWRRAGPRPAGERLAG
jgi:hypothetical protein